MLRNDLTGKKIGRWLVLKRDYSRLPRTYWLCLCSCGTKKSVCGYTLTAALSKSCGCYAIELSKIRGPMLYTTHGEAANKTTTPEYLAWQAMKTRCYNKATHYYHLYGGRGITVCKEWLESYTNFLRDVGRRPSSAYSLDRINNNGSYCPENVRWATKSQQRKNQRTRKEIHENN